MIILFIVFYIAFILLALFSFIFPEYYFSELVLSFLPYSIFISFLWLIFWILFIRFSKKNLSRFKLLFAFIVLLSAVIFFFYSKKFTYFYSTPKNQIINDMTWWVKVFYANIYKNNENYLEIKNRIEKENPDILFFVEFADHHYKNLENFLKENYPYSNSTIWTKKYVWNMVFSKIKIENRADDFPQWAWRYAYFSVKTQDKPIYFYLVHMSSPISLKFFHMRNQQITTFFQDFSLHQESHRIKQDKVVAMGDFNTSPWSKYYWNFAKGFEWEFINITRYLPIIFTWKSLWFPFLWSHIDHVFINKFVYINDFKIVDIPWSDHRWFTFIIR